MEKSLGFKGYFMGDLNKPGDEKLSNFRSDDFKF
jgi:hypothetical protein